MTKQERKNFRQVEKWYLENLSDIELDKMWQALEERYGHHMSITEFLFGTTVLDTENRILQYDTEKNNGGVGNITQ